MALAAQRPGEWVDSLASIVAVESARGRFPSFSVVVVDGDRVVAEVLDGVVAADRQAGPGSSNAEPGSAAGRRWLPGSDEVSRSTLYRTGSVGKTLTDLAVMRAVGRGQLDLDAPIRRYLPEFEPRNPFGGAITLRQLMTHRAGLVREPPVGNYYDAASPSLVATVESLNGTVLLWRPGERTKYSNAGLAVVGRILEVIHGVSFAEVIRAEVFGPAGMETATVGLPAGFRPGSGDPPGGLARGVMWRADGTEWEAPFFDLGMSPAGDMYASMADMAGLLVACLADDGRLAGVAHLREMWTPQNVPPRDDWQLEVGLGFSLDGRFGGRYRMARNGGAVYGFATELALLPDQGLGVYAVAAREGANETVKAVAHWALLAALADRAGEPLPAYESRAVDGSGLAARLASCTTDPTTAGHGRFLGEYGGKNSPLIICDTAGRLHALVEWHSLYPLTEFDDGSFGFPSYALFGHERLRFRAKDGMVTGVVIGNGEMGVFFERMRGPDNE